MDGMPKKQGGYVVIWIWIYREVHELYKKIEPYNELFSAVMTPNPTQF